MTRDDEALNARRLISESGSEWECDEGEKLKRELEHGGQEIGGGARV